MSNPLTFLCVSSFHKGEDFLTAARAEGIRVFLVTSEQLNGTWSSACYDEVFYIKDQTKDKGSWNMEHLIAGLAWLMQSNKIDRVVALDDFDVEKGAHIREHFRIPGMGQTTARYFRDKLAMRIKAQDAGVSVPQFSPIFNDDEVNKYIAEVAPPWLIKPRSEASATGITKAHNGTELWDIIHGLGDRRHHYLVESFRPGDVYHVDSLNVDGKVAFVRVSQYLATPMEVAHGGGVFRSMVCEYGSQDEKTLTKLNAEVMDAFGMQFSASHTEFIKDRETGKFVFLETSSRVGGANLAEMVEMSSGINIWVEWARIEAAMARNTKYKCPKPKNQYAGILVSLARTQWPDQSCFSDPEICWRMHREYHVGLIVASADRNRLRELLDNYAERVLADFHATAPVSMRPAG